ncbi:MAG: hypothetical protein R2810_00735 [Flavobacteriales bacterium]
MGRIPAHARGPFQQQFGPAGDARCARAEEYGGAGLGYEEYITTVLEVGRICGSVGL